MRKNKSLIDIRHNFKLQEELYYLLDFLPSDVTMLDWDYVTVSQRDSVSVRGVDCVDGHWEAPGSLL